MVHFANNYNIKVIKTVEHKRKFLVSVDVVDTKVHSLVYLLVEIKGRFWSGKLKCRTNNEGGFRVLSIFFMSACKKKSLRHG